MLDEGSPCPVPRCDGIFEITPSRNWDWMHGGCTCFVSAPCGYCTSLEIRCSDCDRTPTEVEMDYPNTLVSLDIQSNSCEPESNLLRINPELHFPLNEVFEVPDEFNGHRRGTFYYRNSSGVIRGPFMNTEEAGFDLCRRPFT